MTYPNIFCFRKMPEVDDCQELIHFKDWLSKQPHLPHDVGESLGTLIY